MVCNTICPEKNKKNPTNSSVKLNAFWLLVYDITVRVQLYLPPGQWNNPAGIFLLCCPTLVSLFYHWHNQGPCFIFSSLICLQLFPPRLSCMSTTDFSAFTTNSGRQIPEGWFGMKPWGPQPPDPCMDQNWHKLAKSNFTELRAQ